MFNENEDWNDEQDAQILCKTVLNTKKVERNTNFKAVGKKSLLRTLQTLGSEPEWTSNSHEQKDSDSETEAAPSPSKKKKKRKKRKHLNKSENQQEDGDDGQTVKKEKPLSKKKGNKPGTPKAKSISADETNSESPQVNVNKPQNSEKLSRQKWKNKMKNKRKCKNKFSQNKLEEDVSKADEQEPKGEIKSNSQSNSNNCENISHTRNLTKRKDRKLLKRNNPDDETDGFTPARKKKQQKEKKEISGKADEDSFEGSPDESKQKAAELQVQQSVTRRQKLELSKEWSLKRQKLQKILLRHETDQHETPVDQKETLTPPKEKVKQSRSDSFRARMEQRLEVSRFRYINELLYSTSSGEAKRMFQQDPQAFEIYHKGYTAQVQRWPANPVDEIISYIQKRPSSLVVADFGCGDCKIARSVKNKVHSYDLAATCELATVCDMANVPLGDGSVDIAVFCLSLMGTNLADFLAEASRVLKMGGILKIAEVSSRFDNVRNFITALARLGFKMASKDTENSHFYSFEFVKTGNAPKNTVKFGLQLKPCVYKKR